MTKVYVGTAQGLFVAGIVGDRDYQLDLVGFERSDVGAIRSPVVASREGRLFVATTRSGVWRSDDLGASWQEANRGLVSKEVWALQQHPTSGEIYAGTGPVGVYKSEDASGSWVEFEALRAMPSRADWFLHMAPFYARVRSIAIAEAEPVVVCGIEEGWIVRTDDRGETWHSEREGLGGDVHMVAICPGDIAVVFAATGTGMFRSSDGGRTFARCDDVDRPYVTHVLTHPERPGMVFAVASHNLPRFWRRSEGAGTAFYLSHDYGKSWSRLERGYPDFIAAGAHAATWAIQDPDLLLVGLTDGSIWRIDNDGGGAVWLECGKPVTALSVLDIA